MEFEYDPQHFADVYHTALGRAIWDYINRHDSVTRMVAAAYLGHPSIEVLSPHIEQKFGDEAFAPRVKQMTGHAIRQVMERHGHPLIGEADITTPGNRYTRGAVYRA